MNEMNNRKKGGVTNCLLRDEGVLHIPVVLNCFGSEQTPKRSRGNPKQFRSKQVSGWDMCPMRRHKSPWHTHTHTQHILVTSAHLLAFSATLSISKYFNEPIFVTHLHTQMHGGWILITLNNFCPFHMQAPSQHVFTCSFTHYIFIRVSV